MPQNRAPRGARRDPENHRTARPGGLIVRLGLFAMLLGVGSACDYLPPEIKAMIGGSTGVSEEIKTELKAGDITKAKAALLDASKATPTDVDTALYLAYTQMMSGDFPAADATLAAVEPSATPEQLPGIKLRRAMVALRARDLDAVRDHGRASGLPEGLLLAAEVHIQDLDDEQARKLLDQLKSEPGVVGATATKYLELYNGTPEMNSLADVTALWALGERKEACDNASVVIPDLPDNEEKAELLLLWAGRAATSGQLEVASALRAEMLPNLDPSQSWRLTAIDAIIAIGQGEYQKGMDLFKALENGAPADGLAHARATAAALSGDPEIASQLVGDLESAAVARGLLQAGARDLAIEAAPPSSYLKKFLE